jgi:hypothetical protein|tara:strand:+ start:223 stop:531 length:309 start_codon:yes stop_codon:yes gene_type:complete
LIKLYRFTENPFLVSELNVKLIYLKKELFFFKFFRKIRIQKEAKNMIQFQEVFTYSDQPTTCPKCGNRTGLILDLSHSLEKTQIHKCLSHYCQNKFVTQADN